MFTYKKVFLLDQEPIVEYNIIKTICVIVIVIVICYCYEFIVWDKKQHFLRGIVSNPERER